MFAYFEIEFFHHSVATLLQLISVKMQHETNTIAQSVID